MSAAYFRRTGERTYRATEQTGGAWDTATQHVAPALGLLVHAVEQDRDARRSDGLRVARTSFDILGTMPVAEVEVTVRVLRPGRTIELVEATLAHGGRPAVVLRAWLLEPRATAGIAGTDLAPLPPPAAMEPWDPTTVWPGGFIASVEVRRAAVAPGRGAFWVRTPVALVDGEAASPVARAAGLWDISNGMVARADPTTVVFPNVDLTAHVTREPVLADGWVGFDTTQTYGADGLGLTSSVLHDAAGPLGTSAQVLTVRPSVG
ncbi:acyl-CoA thioesterase domain-containing protein [Nocardioides zeae]|uniref:Thioesterase family protein n=1 Tax=Nocardioides zeae TaxID=1457234 RepID=A0A6P0HNU6_9ACTN|nr:thioesterase family protein [Nocardioides zeae]